MKLLLCKSCGDIFNLSFTMKKCSCGGTRGSYSRAGINATYSGDCVPLCISNPSIINAIAEQQVKDVETPGEYFGARFDAWICPKNSDRFKRLK